MITDHLLKRNILEYISRRRRVFWKVRLLFSVDSPWVSIVYTYQVLFLFIILFIDQGVSSINFSYFSFHIKCFFAPSTKIHKFRI